MRPANHSGVGLLFATPCINGRSLALSFPRPRLQVPNRLNYLLWLEDLVASWHTGSFLCGHTAKPPPLVAIDVGTGASAIFALLGAFGGCRRGCAVEARFFIGGPPFFSAAAPYLPAPFMPTTQVPGRWAAISSGQISMAIRSRAPPKMSLGTG